MLPISGCILFMGLAIFDTRLLILYPIHTSIQYIEHTHTHTHTSQFNGFAFILESRMTIKMRSRLLILTEVLTVKI